MANINANLSNFNVNMSNMKKCSRCGAENRDEGNFCTNCGAGLNMPKPAHSHDKNLIERFKNANIIVKLIIIIVAVYLFLLASAWAGHIFFGMPLESYTEWDSTYRQSQFDSLDINGDGALSFYEVDGLAPGIAYDDLQDIFDSADKNDNGLLKGSEFDGYLHRIEKNLEKQQKSERQNSAQQKSSSSSSSSNPSFQDEGHEICPVCGGDQFSEFYNSQYGEMNWKCDYCGEIYRSDDEFYINYWESNGIKSILPALGNNLAVI